MDIHVVLAQLDQLFEQKKTEEIEPYLSEQLALAIQEQDTSCVISIINELIGFYRDTSQHEKSMLYSEKVISLMQNVGLTGTIHYGITLLNAANAYRAAGELEESLSLYHKVKEIYDRLLAPDDQSFAAYYNNLSLLYQEMGQFERAAESLEEALSIVTAQPDNEIKIATTHANLAESYLHCAVQSEEADPAITENRLTLAEEHARESLALFEAKDPDDFHYCSALTAMADILSQRKEAEQAIPYYEQALIHIEQNMGRGDYYSRVLHNMTLAYYSLGREGELAGLSLAREYYETYGRQMIEEQFPGYADRIAVGYAGEGSECLGLDDELSRDHDFGPGFCMWVTKETADQIGDGLQQAYNMLPKYLHGISRNETFHGQGRTGVCVIESFYGRITGYPQGPESYMEWSAIEEWKLRTATSGEIFTDPEGIFTQIRERLLAYYPEVVWRKRLAQSLTLMAQTGQYNYGRVQARGDQAGAAIVLNHYEEALIDTLFLLNRSYAPYYKWQSVFLRELKVGRNLCDRLFSMMTKEQIPSTMELESIAAEIVEILHELQLTTSQDTYLEHQAEELIKNGGYE